MGLAEIHGIQGQRQEILRQREEALPYEDRDDVVFKFKIGDTVSNPNRGVGIVRGIEWASFINEDLKIARCESEFPSQDQRKRRFFGFRYIVKMRKEFPEFENNELYFPERDLENEV